MNHREYKFCPVCGGNLVFKKEHGIFRQVCSKCEFIFYHNPTPAVGVVVLQDHSVLMVKRKFEPRAGDWNLPAGFMELNESPQETAIREAKEETNLDVKLGSFIGAWTAKDDPRNQVLVLFYHGEIISGKLQAGDDASEAQFFPLDNLPRNIAFKTHIKALGIIKSELRSAT